MPTAIRNWNDLVGLESEHYQLKINTNMGHGWIVPKVETEETEQDYFKHHKYLSTHTFYDDEHKQRTTNWLQEFGFDAEIYTKNN